MSLVSSICVVVFVGFLVAISLGSDKRANFTGGDLCLFSLFGMLSSLILVIPLHFLYLEKEELSAVCDKKGGVISSDSKFCVKKEVYDSFFNKENHLKVD